MSIETIIKAVLQLLPIFPPVPDRRSDPQIPYNAKAKLFREAEREMARIYNENVPILNKALPVAQEVAENLEVIQAAPEYARAAQSSATSADASAKAAKKSETNAATSATSANNAKTGAETAKNAAKTSETNAKASENAALASKNAAKTSETNAANSATAANNSKNGAATSAINAANSASAALASQNTAKSSENAAKASQNAAKTSETNAKTSETAAKTSQDAAKASETKAAASQKAAKLSEDAALVSKNAAQSSATAAASSASAAKNAETTATTSATVAQEILDQIEDVQAGILPPATTTVPGVVKVGSGLNINAGTLSVPFGTVAGTAAQGNDSRIVNAVQKARKITTGSGLTGGGDLSADRTLTVSFGTAAGTACQGNDARLSNARTPTAHKATHKTGGTDALTPADIGAAANTITVSAGNGLTGGGNLTANRSLAVNYATAAPLMDGAAAVGTSVQIARGDHRHPSDTTKLSLSGGTMTGNLVVPAAGFWLRIKDAATTTLRNFRVLTGYGQDGNGAGIAITANGLTIIGGGEAPNTIFNAANMTTLALHPGDEHAIIAADGEVWFLTGIQNFANRKLIKITNVGILETGQQIRFLNGEADKVRMIQGNYGFIMRQDGGNFYFLVTASGQQTGTWTTARPLTINLSTGVCSINGNAATATRLQTARTIALSGGATGTATSFNGSANITIPVTGLDVSKANAGTLPVARGGTGRTDGKAVALATARTISFTGAITGSASFDGSKNLSIATQLSAAAFVKGMIMPFFGTLSGKNPLNPLTNKADTHWHVCDGTDGTPNLQNRFIVGVSSSKGNKTTGGGGNHTHTATTTTNNTSITPAGTVSGASLSEAQLAGHAHNIALVSTAKYASGSGYGYIAGSGFWSGATGSNRTHAHGFVGNAAQHKHTASTSIGAANAGLPPYMALYYIMFMG